MKTIKRLLAAVTVIGLCAACNNDDTLNAGAEGTVSFNANVEHAVLTRGSESTSPYTGALTLWNGSVKGSVSADYTYNTSWSANPPLFWDNLSTAGSGMYTFYATANHSTLNNDATGGAVAADQSANDGYAKADLLAAYTESAKRNQMLNFNLKHLMAQFTVVLNNTTDVNTAFTAEQLRTATLTAKALHTDYTVAWTPTAIAAAVGTAADKQADITLCPDAANASATSGFTFRAIVPATQTVGDVLVTINGKPYTININHAINAGENTVQTLNVAKTGISLGTVSVTNWVENNLGNAALAINISGTNSGTDATQFAEMQLWKRGSSTVSDIQNSIVYKKTAGVWAFDAASNSGKTPFYLDDIAASDQFYALAINRNAGGTAIVDAQTRLADGLIAGPASVSHTTGGGALNLEFHHAHAQMTVVVKAGSAFPAGISLSGAKISTPSMKQTASGTTYNADGSLTLTPTTDDTASPYSNLVTTYDDTKKQAELTAIVIPQTLAAGSKFTVTLANGNTYTAALANEVNVQAGQNNALTLTLNPTTAKVGAVTVADWGTGADAAADAVLDGVTVSAETLNGISENGTLVINVKSETEDRVGNYPIAYTNSVASVNIASAGYEPILWDNLTQYAAGTTLNSCSYKALFWPISGVAGNQERDYLQTEEATVATPFGITPAFSLKHAMGKLVLKLQSDGTYTADQLKAATLTFTSSKYVSGYAAAELIYTNEVRTVTMTNASGASNALGTYTAVVCPQSITGIKLVIAGKTFNLTKGIAFAAGSIHTLTASVNKAVVKIGTVNVNDWLEGGSSTGSFQY